jgi:hypothetical protein
MLYRDSRPSPQSIFSKVITKMSPRGLFTALVTTASLVTADTITASVDLGVSKGKPIHVASGFIYGIPDTADHIPATCYRDIGFNYARAGGAQLEAPSRGWIWGLDEYKGFAQMNHKFSIVICLLSLSVASSLPYQTTARLKNMVPNSSFFVSWR